MQSMLATSKMAHRPHERSPLLISSGISEEELQCDKGRPQKAADNARFAQRLLHELTCQAESYLHSSWFLAAIAFIIVVTYTLVQSFFPQQVQVATGLAKGPYKLIERHVGRSFFDHYHFYAGKDSVGSGGHQIYVSRSRAEELGIFNVTKAADGRRDRDVVYMSSAPGANGEGMRQSIRLEGKRRFNRGLFVLDLDHMPEGAGVWPAWWMTDEAHWPDNGEIDIVENINYQTQAKTALHTSGQCRMYGQVPKGAMTGTWDRATAIPDPSTNKSNILTNIEADDCWNKAAHRWYNQGCVLVEKKDGTMGKQFNERGGGIFALEWDPVGGFIKSWTFPRHALPSNLNRALKSASAGNATAAEDDATDPDPSRWGLPYAYFAIGPKTECSADHFQNMRLVFNLAFCGEVAGQRFFKDCTEEAKSFNVSNSPVKSCNAYIESNPEALEQAFWKIRGVYAWERQLQVV